MNIAKQVAQDITLIEVRLQLNAYPDQICHEYLASKSFASCVEYYTDAQNMSVNEIVAEFKRQNGIGKSPINF